jgi:hypothetical protein
MTVESNFIRQNRQDCGFKLRAILPAKQDRLLASGVPASALSVFLINNCCQRDTCFHKLLQDRRGPVVAACVAAKKSSRPKWFAKLFLKNSGRKTLLGHSFADD